MVKILKNSKNEQILSQNLLDAMFWIPKILVEKKQKTKTLRPYMWDRQTEKQKKTEETKRAKCYYYLIKLAKVCVIG